MRKRMLSIGLVVLLCLSVLGGCGQSPSNVESKTNEQQSSSDSTVPVASGEKKQIKVMWLAAMNQTNVIRQVIEEKFSTEYPDIEIVFSEVANSETGPKAMMEAVGKTGAYDVVMQNLTIPALVGADALEPLDEYIARDGFAIEKMIDNGISYKDHYYGLPVRGDVRVLHYNEEYYKAAGLDPEKPPKSMEEFVEYGRQLTRDGRYGINCQPTAVDNFTSFMFQYGGDFMDPNTQEPVFNSEAGIKALELIIKLRDEGTIDPNAMGWQNPDEIAAYLGGGAAMYDAWPARYVDASMPEKSAIAGHSRVAALPGDKSLVSGWYLVMFNTCKEKDAAWEFMKYVVSPEIQKEVILRGGDCNPTHLDVLNDLELQEKFEVLRAVKDSFEKTQVYCKSTQYQGVRDILTTHIAFALNGDKSPKQALDDAAAEARKLLVEAGEIKS